MSAVSGGLSYSEFSGFVQSIYGAGVTGAAELAGRIGAIKGNQRGQAQIKPDLKS